MSWKVCERLRIFTLADLQPITDGRVSAVSALRNDTLLGPLAHRFVRRPNIPAAWAILTKSLRLVAWVPLRSQEEAQFSKVCTLGTSPEIGSSSFKTDYHLAKGLS